MSRALYRGLSTPERIRPQLPADEPGSPADDREEAENEERSRSRPLWETCFPHSMRLWIKQNLSFSSSSHSSSSNKHSLKLFDAGSKSGKNCESPGSQTANSLSGPGAGFSTHCFSLPCSNRKLAPVKLLPLLLVFLIGAFACVTLLGSNRSNPRVVFTPHNYRRAQLLAWKDLMRGGILGRGLFVSDPREVAACPPGMEDYIPCYVESGTEVGEADLSPSLCDFHDRIRCLVPPPRDYNISLKWPESKDSILRGNVVLESTVKDRFFIDGDLLKVTATDGQLVDDDGSYEQQVSAALSLGGVTDFTQAGIRSVLDLGCSFGNLGAKLWEHNLLTMCVAPYMEHGGQAQIALERGIPALVGNLATKQLPFPSSSYDLIHCRKCGMERHLQGGLALIEIDRLMRRGAYFVFVSADLDGSTGGQVLKDMKNITSTLGWRTVSPLERDGIAVWQKKTSSIASKTQKLRLPFCDMNRYDADWSWNQALRTCITVSPPDRLTSVQQQLVWPARLQFAPIESPKSGPEQDEVTDEPHTWATIVAEYQSLLTPIIFSDHPKRIGDEDVKPPANLVRNVMDLNAGHGALNAAFIIAGVPVWVMNVIPTSAINTLPEVFDRGLVGASHDWCYPFPTYPRTYDFLHAADLLSQELKREDSCGLAHLFLEMDRILRPEGWVFLRDDTPLIEDARSVASQLRWESRLVEVIGDRSQRLLVCQKTFWKS